MFKYSFHCDVDDFSLKHQTCDKQMIGTFVVADQNTLRLDHMIDVFVCGQHLGNSDAGSDSKENIWTEALLKSLLKMTGQTFCQLHLKAANRICLVSVLFLRTTTPVNSQSVSAKDYLHPWQLGKFNINPTPIPPLTVWHSLPPGKHHHFIHHRPVRQSGRSLSASSTKPTNTMIYITRPTTCSNCCPLTGTIQRTHTVQIFTCCM